MEDACSSKPVKDKPYFRDTLQTIDEKGKRHWIYPKRPAGKLYNYRGALAMFLLLFFFTAPFITFRGEPFMLLNVLERKFVILGQVFWPQDFHLIVLSIIALLVFIILFTVNFGRIFCGWACPQTVFMEFVFRQVEYLIEGDNHKQKKLDKQPLNFEKFWKKGLKHIVFFLLAFWVVNTIAAYLVGGEKLGAMIKAGPAFHTTTFMVVVLFSAAFYGIYAFFREQVCIIVCPYGRLQGVLLDDQSIIVAYDYKRGEPRTPFNPAENFTDKDKGHCIDCSSCVVVCPTGIDIRNGTQLECINCTACIDACNRVMDRVKLPRNLVRFDSEKSISTGLQKYINARSIAYTIFLTLILMVTTLMFLLRGDIEATVLRMPGSIYQEYGPDSYANIYKIQVVNKTRRDMPVELHLSSIEGEIMIIGQPIKAMKGEVTEANFMIVISAEKLSGSNTPIRLDIYSEGVAVANYRTNFLAPASLDQ